MSEPTMSTEVFCRRNRRFKAVPEHQCCPYCFNRDRAVVERGEYSRFCDFEPKEDAVTFGFAADASRNLCQ